MGSDPVQLAIATQPAGGTATLTCTANPVSSSAAGVATFAGCSISGPVGAYTLSATDTADGQVVATSTTITLSPGTATHLAFVQEPSNAQAASTITPAVTVAVEDAANNVETANHTTTVSLAIGTNPSGGSLTGGSATTVVAGVATFSGLSINKAGTGYTLVASSAPALTTATSTAFTIAPGAANHLVFVQGPSNAVAGAAISPAVTVAVEDTNGNVETGDNTTTVSLAIGTNPSGGTLTGGAAVTVSAGVATFSGLSVNKVGVGYTLAASSTPSYTAATSSGFSITVGAPTRLAFMQEPSNTAAGSAVSPAVTVAVEDANGNIETGDQSTTVTLAFANNPSGATLSGGSATTVVSGIATFSGLSVNKVGTGYTLSATSAPANTAATSSAFNISAGPATQLAFVQGPSNTAASSVITPAVTVAVEDADGNVETGNNTTQVTLAIGNNPASGTLSGGSAVTVVSGVATFTALSINNAGSGYTLSASSAPSLAGATSSSFTITPGTASKLAFVQGPSTTQAGSAVSPAVTVAVEDANGNVETGNNTTTVSLAIGTNPSGGTLSGGAAVTVSAGIATFSTLSINKAGNGYTLIASSTPSFTAATSSSFSITAGPATQLAFVQGPSNAQAGSSISPAVTVAVEDANGNVVTSDNTTTVTLAIGSNPSGGTLTGGSAVPVSAGIATFSGLSINKVGIGYTLTASSTPTFNPATSPAFSVTPGTATQLVFVQGPTSAVAGSIVTPAVTVAEEDADGNVEFGDNTTEVTLTIGTNPGGGTLAGGTAVTVSAGIATFSALSIDKAGTGYTLIASSTPSLAAATSPAFTITPGVATHLAFIQGPSNAQAGSAISPAVTVAVEDGNNNIETGDNPTQVVLAIGTNPSGGTLTGGSAVTVASGIATFSNLSIDLIGAGYTLSASSTPSYTSAVSSPFSITPGAATHLGFIQGPSSTAAGSAISPVVTVAVEDANGNVETGDNSTTISLAIGTNPSSGTLTGGSAVTVSAGVAAFSALSIDKVGSGYTLAASSTPSFTTATSSAFTVTPGAANNLVFIQGPSNAQAGSAISPAVTVAVEDASGNVETGNNTTTVTLAIGNNPGAGTLTGGSAVTVSAGVATFAGLSINKVGIGYTLTASSNPSYAPATSSPFSILPGVETQLAFVQGPSDAAAGAEMSPSVTVAVEDADGNVEFSDNGTQVTLAIGTNPSAGTLSGGGAVTVSAGIATFPGLSIDNIGTGYTLSATSSPTYTAVTSSAFDITQGVATHLAFVQGPSTSVAGVAITPAVSVAVEDASNNIETGDNSTQVTLAIGTNPSSGTLIGGSALTVSSGVATFSVLSINNAGVGYTLVASSTPSYAAATSAPFDVTPGTPDHLAFIQGPSNAIAGGTIAPNVTVAVEDASGNVETGDNTTTVGLAIGTNPGAGTLTGGAAVAVSDGVATFSGLSINAAGSGYTLTASSTPTYTGATSSAFDLSPGTPTQLAFVQGPVGTVAGSDITPAITVAVEDASGNVETSDNTTQVSLAIGTNPGGGTLTGGSPVTVSGGIATFSALSIDKVGTGYTLSATSSPSYTSAPSTPFDVTVGAATQLVFSQSPPSSSTAGSALSPAVTVAVEDANGNVETSDSTTQVSLAIGTNPDGGTLTGGSPVTVSDGVATFSALSIDKVGTGYTLSATSTPSYIDTTSSPFDITPGVATQLAFVQGPSTTVADALITPAVTVVVEDAEGNVETSDDATQVALAVGTDPNGGTLTGGAPTTVSAGEATFSVLSINQPGNGYTLVASSNPSEAAVTSSAFDVTPGAADQLAFIQGPSDSLAGGTVNPAVTVAVEDVNGNIETGDNATQVSLAIGTNPSSGTLTGGSPTTVVSGVATFSGLSIDKTGMGYTLTATSSTSLPAATSSEFDIAPGPATQLAFVQQPTDAVAGADITPAVTVAVEDAEGNVETSDSSTQVALAVGTDPGGGTLGGGAASTVSAGVATFTGLTVDEFGTGYTLAATSSPAYTGATSSPFTVTSGELGLSCVPPPGSPATQCEGVDLPAITLDGNGQTVSAPGNSLYVTDERGLANVGWSVSAYLMPTPGNPNSACASIATFCNGSVGASAANPQGQIPATDFSVGGLTCTAVAGNSSPNPLAGPGGAFPAGGGAVSLCTAEAGQSSGTFKLGATYSLTIPEGVYAGNYQATVEYLAF